MFSQPARCILFLSFSLLVLVLVGVATSVPAAEPGVSVELNKAGTEGESFEMLKLDLVIFDGVGLVATRFTVETAPLPAGKTNLEVLYIAGRPATGSAASCSTTC